MSNQHALIIGVDESEVDRHLQPLQYACADARATHLVFSDVLGYGGKALLLEKPDLTAVRRALRRIGKDVRAGDTFVFYFAGHGAAHGADQLLLLSEVDLLALDRGEVTGNDVLSLDNLMGSVGNWPAVQAAFILDACRKPLRKGERAARYSAEVEQVLKGVVARNAQLRRQHHSALAKAELPFLVMNACGDMQQAYEVDDLRRGLFSHVFCEWLKEGAREGMPRVLGERAGMELAQRLQATAERVRAPTGQKPWVTQSSTDVVLWRPAPKKRTETQQDVDRLTGSGRSAGLPQLLQTFEQQLQTGRLHYPPLDCCIRTIALLEREGLGLELLQIYANRVEAAQQAQAANVSPTIPAAEPTTLPAPDQDGKAPVQPSPAHSAVGIRAAPPTTTSSTHGGCLSEDPPLSNDPIVPAETLQVQPTATPLPTKIVQTQPTALSQMPAGHPFRDAPWAPEMVVVPAGTFDMGSPDDEIGRFSYEGPQHRVVIDKPFGLGRCVVTFDEYDRFARATGRPLPSDEGWGREGMPVINVSWKDAQAYLIWLNQMLGFGATTVRYRLPTEAEWEYAARANSQSAFWWGHSITPGQANYDGSDVGEDGVRKGHWRQKTVRADAFDANAWGLHNVHGNVWEWVQDGWHETYKGAPRDGSEWIDGADKSLRVARGGSWSNFPRHLRAANRCRYSPGYVCDFIFGFRVAKTL